MRNVVYVYVYLLEIDGASRMEVQYLLASVSASGQRFGHEYAGRSDGLEDRGSLSLVGGDGTR